MPTPLKPWTAKLLELLADGEWHERDVVLTAACHVVPPGVATRATKRLRDRNPSNAPWKRLDDVRVGARDCVNRSLLELVRNRRVERDGNRLRLIAHPAPESPTAPRPTTPRSIP